MRIAFLFNHDQAHQVAHSLPVAAALATSHPEVTPVAVVTSDRLADEVARLSARFGVALPTVRLTHRRPATRAMVRLLDGVAPMARLAILRDNLDFFAGLDALVVTEKTSLVLKRRHGLRLPIIHTRHGAGDRAIGFDRQSALFDHVLVSGPKIRERLIADAGVAADRISTVGYPKFDLPAPTRPSPFADPGRPVVLYNPHPAPHLSSWYRHGRAVLEFFVRSDRYNLVFAPHVMLFQRPFAVAIERRRIARVGGVPGAVRRAPNILIDLGSPASTDMSYTAMADLYLGDVSSQLYEFLLRPRPCLFLDAHGAGKAPDKNHAGWRAGPVIDDPAALGGALDGAVASFPEFRAAQQELFARTFDLRAETSSSRAARAILAALGRRGPAATPAVN
jgi:hypothetical protein